MAENLCAEVGALNFLRFEIFPNVLVGRFRLWDRGYLTRHAASMTCMEALMPRSHGCERAAFHVGSIAASLLLMVFSDTPYPIASWLIKFGLRSTIRTLMRGSVWAIFHSRRINRNIHSAHGLVRSPHLKRYISRRDFEIAAW